MLNETQIIKKFKSGKTIAEIAREEHVANNAISQIIHSKNLPSSKIVCKANNYPGFKE